MQLKSSLLLLTALAAGSAVARLHGHERRHAHPAVEERGVGDVVYATIDGVLVSWRNEYSGEVATAAAAVATTTSTTTAAAAAATTTPASSSTDTSSNADWASTPSDGKYSRVGFGEATSSSGSGDSYCGNVGSPWGTNIIEVSAADAPNYQYVTQFVGSNTDKWTVVIWNKCGPDGKLDGWYGHSALTFSLEAGETKYVAFDSNSQGAWGAAKGDSLPKDAYGGWSCTWGEYDFGDELNEAWSGWDVSAIQAQAANQEVQGMSICESTGSGCSSITSLAAAVENAYTYLERFLGGIGGNSNSGAVRLAVQVDYS
jgi:hypothetical protein